MPYRKVKFITGNIYHLLQRSIDGSLIFSHQKEIKILLELLKYYLSPNPAIKFSIYRQNKNFYSYPDISNPLIKILSYCIMPNHLHLVVQQNQENGIKKYMHKVLSSFSHYFNLKNKRKGPLFEGIFKAIPVENDEQLIHLSRYIHLNPTTAYLVDSPQAYPYSSFNTYLGKETLIPIDTSFIMANFKFPYKYKEFVLLRKKYQRRLAQIKYLLLE